MDAPRWVTPAIYAGLAVVALVVAWLALPDRPETPSAPEQVVVAPEAPPETVGRASRPEAAARNAAPLPIARVDRGAEALQAGNVDERGAQRAAGVPERRAKVEQKLAEIAASRGWDAETSSAVRGILLETLEEAESKLAGVHDPDEWTRMRLYHARHRQLQARRVRSVLGDEEFAAFMTAKSFPRIPSTTGQQPIRWFPYKLRDDD